MGGWVSMHFSLLHSKQQKLHRVLAVLSAIGLSKATHTENYDNFYGGDVW